MRLALALGRADVIESAVLEETGEMERWPCGVCEGDVTGDGEPNDETEGADMGSVEAGTDARYSAPPMGDDGDCTLPT